MGTINIYHDEDNATYQVSANLRQGVLSYETYLDTGKSTGEVGFYIELITNMRKNDGTAFKPFVIKKLTDVPPAVTGLFTPTSPATSWTNLINQYVEYYLAASQFGYSSSSSSTSSTSSSSSTSSNSSSTSSYIENWSSSSSSSYIENWTSSSSKSNSSNSSSSYIENWSSSIDSSSSSV